MEEKMFSPQIQQNDGGGSQPQNVTVNRTIEGTVFEIVTALEIVALWICIAYMIVRSGGDPIPTHFDIAGRPDSYGSPYWLLLVGGVGTATGVFYLLAAYHPTTWISMSFPVRTPLQIEYTVRWARLMAVELPLLCMTLTFGGMEMFSPLFKTMIFIVMATCLGGIVMIRAVK